MRALALRVESYDPQGSRFDSRSPNYDSRPADYVTDQITSCRVAWDNHEGFFQTLADCGDCHLALDLMTLMDGKTPAPGWQERAKLALKRMHSGLEQCVLETMDNRE